MDGLEFAKQGVITMATKKTPTTAKDNSTKLLKSKESVVEPVAATRKKRTTKVAPSKLSPNLTVDPKPKAAEPTLLHEEISLRAYFIAERRHQMGWQGDSASDWADAVSQLRAEALEKLLKKR